ncbi:MULTISPECIES: response regulator [Fervidobacterium]|uniref:Response regulator receiver protein n=1 Tax=Fervidobacterium nodosum (strain ATCC 35602 / DSM 5306 / Rt17-B1) TaxID=381764 RepID=A7HMY7_FERNB|nr:MULTISPECIES: response regulator [Fervidobacterium]ABS61270.1 response regulator receiver protein [Fervidobacterium nodosum Rt17-B1]KAF2961009.1 two-component system response regulator [Fervidobacterium sp. 2310opik-2]PHJ14404.1 chemotaxis protein CheY [Fervidobacterium sp. SC_NGM5_G05]HOJ93671.1 response regulator [Fervidobacterium nodosum]
MPKRILVVEDEPNMRLLVTEELTDAGYDVDEAANGEEALRKFTEKTYDLVTIDIEMPGMNGLELAGKLREIKRDVKLVLLTAYSHYKSDMASWAADAYVVKSSDLTELKEIISRLINM